MTLNLQRICKKNPCPFWYWLSARFEKLVFYQVSKLFFDSCFPGRVKVTFMQPLKFLLSAEIEKCSRDKHCLPGISAIHRTSFHHWYICKDLLFLFVHLVLHLLNFFKNKFLLSIFRCSVAGALSRHPFYLNAGQTALFFSAEGIWSTRKRQPRTHCFDI